MAGVLALVGQGLSLPADTVVDASGCLVAPPGGIDAHTDRDNTPAGAMTSADDFETGTLDLLLSAARRR